MGRLLFILLIVVVVIWWIKTMRTKQQPPRQEEQPPQDVQPAPEDMVRCAQCGVHLPRSESFLVGGKYYCSEAHSRGSSGKIE